MSDDPKRHTLVNGYGKTEHNTTKQSMGEDVVRSKIVSTAEVAVCKRPVLYTDGRTKLIMRSVFSELCPACGKWLKVVEREVRDMGSHDARLIRKVSHLIVQFIRETDQLSANLDSFSEEEQKWHLHSGNMHSEFSKVTSNTFDGKTNWGRVLMFFGFSVSFSVYLEQGIVVGAADSVLEWTCQVVEEDLAEFFLAHQGWEGFSDYLETALRATRRSHLKKRNIEADSAGETSGEDERGASRWNGAFAAGAVAVGAVAALTLRQVFS